MPSGMYLRFAASYIVRNAQLSLSEEQYHLFMTILYAGCTGRMQPSVAECMLTSLVSRVDFILEADMRQFFEFASSSPSECLGHDPTGP